MHSVPLGSHAPVSAANDASPSNSACTRDSLCQTAQTSPSRAPVGRLPLSLRPGIALPVYCSGLHLEQA